MAPSGAYRAGKRVAQLLCVKKIVGVEVECDEDFSDGAWKLPFGR
jgi:hypothetical protein